MNSMSERDVATQVQVLGWLYIIGHALFLAIGAFIFVLLVGIGAVSQDAQAFGVLTIVGVCVGGLMVLLALPGLLAGYGLLRRRNWGRIVAIIVAILNLPNFPLGTLLGLYALFVLLQIPVDRYFGTQAA